MDEIINHYGSTPEDTRLQSGWGLLEFARTQELLLRYLPAPPKIVLDVGGGVSTYSEWLGSLSYETHLIDLVTRHIEQARRTSKHIASAEIGDARQLGRADNSVDAVVLFGPLYHLTNQNDRLRALAEARRVLRPGGLLFAAAICRFASLLASMVESFFDDPRLGPIIERDLRDGQHRNTTGDPKFFTTAFFHRPEELQEEIRRTGFSIAEILPVEGPAWLANSFEECWSRGVRREKLLAWVRAIEHEATLLAVSPHLLAIAHKEKTTT
jgi:ubiquinone/menaquinone biosynthesis C-methylase UbiE